MVIIGIINDYNNFTTSRQLMSLVSLAKDQATQEAQQNDEVVVGVAYEGATYDQLKSVFENQEEIITDVDKTIWLRCMCQF